MRRMAIIVVIGLMLPAIPALAADQQCTTMTIEWTDREQPLIAEVHYATIGIRVAVVGDYLWTQYETTSDPADGGPVLSTLIEPGVTAIEACPDGMVIMTVPPLTIDKVIDAEETEAGGYLVIDVIVYWQGQGYRVY